MEEKEIKKVDYRTIVIVILVIMLVGAIGYIVYDKLFAKEDKEIVEKNKTEEEKEEEVTIKELTVESEEVKELMNTFVIERDCDDTVTIKSLDDNSSRIYLAYTRAHTNQEMPCSKLDNKLLEKRTCGELTIEELRIYMDNLGKLIEGENLNNVLNNKTANYVSKEDFDKKMKELFGKDIKYTYDDIYLGMHCDVVHYDTNLKRYIRYSGYNCGGACAKTEKTLESISQDNDKLTLVIRTKDKIINYNFKYEDNHYIFVNMEY